MSLLTVSNLCKSFRYSFALRKVSFNVVEGESIVLLGNNGAGKSTLLSCIAGVLRADSGEIKLSGSSSPGDPLFRRQVGFVSSELFLYEDLSVRENLQLFAELHLAEYSKPEIEAFAESFGVESFLGKRVAECSQGMKRRASIVRAMLLSPKVLLLDEPFAHLDQQSRENLSQILKSKVEQGITVLVATNDLFVRKHHGKRIIELENGRLKG